MTKTGRGTGIAALTNSGDPEKDKKKKVIVKATGGGETWDMEVAEGAGYDKLSKKLGTVPRELRNLKGVTKDTDPYAAGISSKEMATRKKLWDK